MHKQLPVFGEKKNPLDKNIYIFYTSSPTNDKYVTFAHGNNLLLDKSFTKSQL